MDGSSSPLVTEQQARIAIVSLKCGSRVIMLLCHSGLSVPNALASGSVPGN